MKCKMFKLSTAEPMTLKEYVAFLQEQGLKIVNYSHNYDYDYDYYILINSLEDLDELQQKADNLSRDLGLKQWGLIIDFNDDCSKTNKSITIYNDWRE